MSSIELVQNTSTQRKLLKDTAQEFITGAAVGIIAKGSARWGVEAVLGIRGTPLAVAAGALGGAAVAAGKEYLKQRSSLNLQSLTEQELAALNLSSDVLETHRFWRIDRGERVIKIIGRKNRLPEWLHKEITILKYTDKGAIGRSVLRGGAIGAVGGLVGTVAGEFIVDSLEQVNWGEVKENILNNPLLKTGQETAVKVAQFIKMPQSTPQVEVVVNNPLSTQSTENAPLVKPDTIQTVEPSPSSASEVTAAVEPAADLSVAQDLSTEEAVTPAEGLSEGPRSHTLTLGDNFLALSDTDTSLPVVTAEEGIEVAVNNAPDSASETVIAENFDVVNETAVEISSEPAENPQLGENLNYDQKIEQLADKIDLKSGESVYLVAKSTLENVLGTELDLANPAHRDMLYKLVQKICSDQEIIAPSFQVFEGNLLATNLKVGYEIDISSQKGYIAQLITNYAAA